MSTPFRLEAAIAAWRRPLETNRTFRPEDLDELEGHVRDLTDQFVLEGCDVESAFRKAVNRLGHRHEMEDEFQKIHWQKHRAQATLIMALKSNVSMLLNQIRMAATMLKRRPGYTTINITGLTVALAGFLLLGAYVLHESSYDAFFEGSDRLYRVVYDWETGRTDTTPELERFSSFGMAPAAPALEAEIPGIAQAVRFSGGHGTLIARGVTAFQEQHAFYVDPNVFDVFSFPLVQGDPATALSEPGSVVLSESTVRRYFGSENAMGQSLREGADGTLTVTGIMRDIPSNSHFRMDMLFPMASMERWAPDYMMQSWSYADFFTYVMLSPETNIQAVRDEMPAFAERHAGDIMEARNETFFIDFEPITSAYMSPVSDRHRIGPKGNPENIRVLAIVAFFILAIACINFTNLTTARASERAREVGIRKVMGSERQELILRFLAESTALAFVSLIVALLLVVVSSPGFQTLSGFEFPFRFLTRSDVISVLVLLPVAVGLLAGCYPALVLSAFRPATVLKGGTLPVAGRTFLRKTLVVAQYAVTIGLLVAMFVVQDQVSFMQNRDPGFRLNHQLVVDYGGDRTVNDNLGSILTTLEAHPDVQHASATRTVPGGPRPNATTIVQGPDGAMDRRIYQVFEVDYGFIEQLNLEMVAGRAYSKAFPSDTTGALVITESAARLHGWTNPGDAVGSSFTQWGSQGEVIGVVRDFHHESMIHAIQPLSLRLNPSQSQVVMLDLSAANIQETLGQIQALWSEIVPHRPFDYQFLDDAFAAQYESEQRFGRLFGLFGALALFVACLGLLGTAAFNIKRRTKEIGVRKVLGADSGRIVVLLIQDTLVVLSISLLVASPLAWMGMQRWLDGFPVHTNIRWIWFAATAGLVLLFALGTVAWQTYRAATTPPVRSLRTE